MSTTKEQIDQLTKEEIFEIREAILEHHNWRLSRAERNLFHERERLAIWQNRSPRLNNKLSRKNIHRCKWEVIKAMKRVVQSRKDYSV